MNKKEEKRSKDQAASPSKPEDLSPLELFMASGFDISKIARLNVSKLLIWKTIHRSDILTPRLSYSIMCVNFSLKFMWNVKCPHEI
jgi:hypothetical protein